VNPLLLNKKPVIIMGGGPTLPRDMTVLADLDAVRISCNWRAAKAYPADYIAYIDVKLAGRPMAERLATEGVGHIPTIAPDMNATHFRAMQLPHPINTGIYAAGLAAESKGPIILAGIEFYSGPELYYHGGGWVRESNRTPQYFDRCVQRLLAMARGRECYVVSGPLVGVLPEWKA
jgi:hypothetical protein